MSNAEVTLGAHLYISAIESDVPHLLKHGSDYATKEQLFGLGNSFRNAAKWMTKNKVVTIETVDGDRKWKSNDEVISNLTEEKNAEFTPYYDTLVQAHLPVLSALEASGKMDYVETFNQVHKPVEIEIEPETAEVLSDDSMKNVVAASLNFLDAVEKDPANSAFIAGLAAQDLENLHQALSDADYLMPEDAPADRQAPLGEQALRGTQEQREAIFENASVLAANITLPDSIQQGDAPTMAAAMVMRSIEGAEVEHVVVENVADLDAPNPWNSDLMREDAQTINKVFLAGTQLANSSQFDTEDFDNILVEREKLAALAEAIAEYQDHNIGEPLGRSSFMAPGLSVSSAKQISKTVKLLDEIANYDHEAEQVHGDEGGSATESSYAAEDEADHLGDDENQFENDVDDGIINDLDEDAAAPGMTNDDREDMLGHVDPYVKIDRALMDSWDSASISMIANGVDQTLTILAGDDENTVSSLRSGVDRAAFATFTEAARGGSMGQASVSLYSDTMSFRRHAEMNPSKKAEFEGKRVVKIEPGRGFLKDTGYKPVSSESAAARVGNFVRENMIVDGQPNKLLRSHLREIAQKPVIAATTAEASAWKNEALSFVQRDDEEKKLRRETVEKDKTGHFYADFSSEDASKFVNIIAASKSKELARVSLDKNGGVTITHPEGPTLSSSIPNPPKELASSGQEVRNKGGQVSQRTFGGNIDPSRIRAALESSPNSQGVTLVMAGETPKGVIAKVNEVHTKTKEVDRFPDMALT